jgi:hypothetical protein
VFSKNNNIETRVEEDIMKLFNYVSKIANQLAILDSTSLVDNIANFKDDLPVDSIYSLNIACTGNWLTYIFNNNTSVRYLLPFMIEDSANITGDKSHLLAYDQSNYIVPIKLYNIVDELNNTMQALNEISTRIANIYMSSAYNSLLLVSKYSTRSGATSVVNKQSFVIHGYIPNANLSDILVDPDAFFSNSNLLGYSIISRIYNQTLESAGLYQHFVYQMNTNGCLTTTVNEKFKVPLPAEIQIIKSSHAFILDILRNMMSEYANKCVNLASTISFILSKIS